MEEKLREYAHLIVSVGLNLQKGQTLILSSPVECAPFARLCVSAAYDLGAGEVVLNWTDDYITRERFLRAQDAAFETPRPWRRAFFTDYANEGAAYLRIDAEDPETLLGVSPATHHGKPFAIWSRSKVSRSADEVRCAATSRAGDTPSSVSGSSASMRR